MLLPDRLICSNIRKMSFFLKIAFLSYFSLKHLKTHFKQNQGLLRCFPDLLLNSLKSLILLETHFQVFQGKIRQIKLFSRKMMFS